jgi:multicomponent Na+:H+ antiporter subunit F
MILALVILLCAVAIAMALWRVLSGPTHADRIVALDILLACAIGLCLLAALAAGRTVYVDVAIGLAVVGFVATVGWARVVESSRATSSQGERS